MSDVLSQARNSGEHRREADGESGEDGEVTPVPSWLTDAHDGLALRGPAAGAEPDRGPSALWLVAGALVVAALFAGFAAGLLVTRDDGNDQATAVPSTELSSTALDASSDLLELPDASNLPEGEDGDRMSIRIETPASADSSAAGSAIGATATVREDGRVYFEGAFRSQDEADRFVSRAAEVFGAEAIVEDYTIDPNAPAPAAGDVALDKPVLFETGSATIHPAYVPFLEACGDILKLNPHITMSIAAFTDSVGDEDFNLELSQQRAQAIVDFYRNLDVDPDQLVGSGFGEAIPVADNDTEEGRAENRRAMLQLLNVMGEEGPPAGGDD